MRKKAVGEGRAFARACRDLDSSSRSGAACPRSGDALPARPFGDPMDERQTQIRERAGLEEARYNLEFIDWLRKWGVPILFVFAVAAAAWGLRERYQRSQAVKLDESFAELEAVASGSNPSPESLLQIANDHASGRSSVAEIAKLEAADAYLDSIRRGVRPGAQLQPDGTLEKPEDVLSEADRKSFQDRAYSLYNEVFNATRSNAGKQVLTIGALFGMASVAESQGEIAKARGHYEEVSKLADASGFTAYGAVAKKRLENLDALQNPPVVYSKADLPPVPEAPKPVQPVLTPIDAPPFAVPPELQPQPQPVPEGAQPLIPPPAAPPAPEPAPQPVPPQPDPAPAPAEPAPK